MKALCNTTGKKKKSALLSVEAQPVSIKHKHLKFAFILCILDHCQQYRYVYQH